MKDENDMYMGGVGVMERTQELIDAAWAAVPLAWLGSSAGCLAAIYSVFWRFVSYPTELSHGFRPSMQYWADYGWIVIVVIGIGAAFGCFVPWWLAMRNLRRHREAMAAETRKRGKGWARS